MEINQYQIVLVNLDPTVGSEIKKTRPCAVLSPNEMNQFLKILIIAPITSASKPYPTRIEINQKKTKGWLVLDQIRTIDKSRVVAVFNSLSEKEIKKTKAIMQELFVD